MGFSREDMENKRRCGKQKKILKTKEDIENKKGNPF